MMNIKIVADYCNPGNEGGISTVFLIKGTPERVELFNSLCNTPHDSSKSSKPEFTDFEVIESTLMNQSKETE